MEKREVVQLIEKLKDANHSVNPSASWVSQNRAQLLQHIARTTEEIPTRTFSLVHIWSALSLIMPQRTVYSVVRPAVIFVVCFTVGTAGWLTTVSASINSLPGDALYPVKLATEHTQVAVAQVIQGNAATAELHLSFATRRADEVHKIIETTTIDAAGKQERVQQAVENLKTEVQNVSQNLAQAQQGTSGDAVAIAKAVDRKVDELQQTLQAADVHVSGTNTTAVAIQNLRNEIARVKLTDIAVTTSSPASASSTFQIDFTLTLTTSSTPSAPSTSSTATIVVGHPAARPTVAAETPTTSTTVINEKFPDRPRELAPDVVDTSTPVKIETWDETINTE